MRQTWAKVTPKRAFEILAHLEDSGSEANSTETYKIKRKLTAKMIEHVEIAPFHVENWVAGLDFASAKRGPGRAKMASDAAVMGPNGAKKCLRNPSTPGRFRF